MRPITVTVGPLATANAANICASQTPNAGTTMLLNGALGTVMFQGTGSILGNVLTITAVSSGVLTAGTLIAGSQVASGAVVLSPISPTTNGIGTYVLSKSMTTVSSTTIYGGQVATLDTPRRVLLTPAGNESANTFTIVGTGWNYETITEVLTGGNATATYTNMDFRTVTSITPTNTAASTIIVGTNTVASTMWVRFDEYSTFPTAIQITVTGTVSYTVQQTLQDSNNPFGTPIQPYQVTWINSADPSVVAAVASTQSSYTYAPIFAKVVLNSGSGSVSAVFSQNSSSSF